MRIKLDNIIITLILISISIFFYHKVYGEEKIANFTDEKWSGASLFNLNYTLDYLSAKKQNRDFRLLTSIPTISDLIPNEIGLYYTGSDYRIYSKINGSIVYSPMSTTNIFLSTSVYSQNSDKVDGFHLDQNVLTTSSPTFSNLYVTNNVGIGLTNPANKLEVNGTTRIGTTSTNYLEVITVNTGQSLDFGNEAYIRTGKAVSGFITAVSISSSTGNTSFAGYTKLGEVSPKMKCVIFSTVTAATEGGSASVAHGLSSDAKILSISALIYTGSNYVTHGYLYPGLKSRLYTTTTHIVIVNDETESEIILNKSVRIMMWYEE